MGNHAEAIQIEYNPDHISYEELLEHFWKGHDPTAWVWSRQYMSAIFFHNDEQMGIAKEGKSQEEEKRKKKIRTEIVSFTEFFPAEDYHQKYILQNNPKLMREFQAMYPTVDGLISSTAAARVNGYLAGYGDPETLMREVDTLGLSPDGKKRLLDHVKPSFR